MAYGPVLGRTGTGLGFGAKVLRATAPLPAPALERGAVLETDFAAAFSATFLAGGAVFLAGGAFLAADAGFLGAAAAFFETGADLFSGAAFFALGDGFFVAAVAFLGAAAAFFTTGTAFFLVRAGRFVAVPATLPAAFLFPAFLVAFPPARDDPAVAAARDADTLLTWAPLLAGVIDPSFGPRAVAGLPDDDHVVGAGDHSGPRRQEQHRRPPSADCDQTVRGAPETAASEALCRFRVGGPSSASAMEVFPTDSSPDALCAAAAGAGAEPWA